MTTPSIVSSLISRLNKTTSPPEQLSLLQTIIHSLPSTEPEQKQEYLTQALTLAKQLKKRDKQAWCHKQIGECYTDLGNYREALEAFAKAHSLFRDLDYNEESIDIALAHG